MINLSVIDKGLEGVKTPIQATLIENKRIDDLTDDKDINSNLNTTDTLTVELEEDRIDVVDKPKTVIKKVENTVKNYQKYLLTGLILLGAIILGKTLWKRR